jgi:hypothetical protein
LTILILNYIIYNEMYDKEPFLPDQFDLAYTIKKAELDHEVAARIANTVFRFNNRSDSVTPNNVVWDDDFIGVHVEKIGHSYGPAYALENDKPMGFHLYHPENTYDLAQPQEFAKSLLTALNKDEQIRRPNVKRSLIEASFMPGLTFYFGGYFAERAIATGQAAYIFPALFSPLSGTLMSGGPLIHNIFRRTLANPDFNQLHMHRLSRRIAKMGLPDVIEFSEQPPRKFIPDLSLTK